MTTGLAPTAPGTRSMGYPVTHPRHLLIPLMAALLGVAASVMAGRAPGAAFTMGSFFFVLAHIAVIDLREHRIPNAYTYAGTAVALLLALALGQEAFRAALLGFLAGGGAMLLLYLAGGGRMGLGDVKMGAFIGAMLGVQAVPAFLIVSSLFGTLAAVYTIIRTGDRRSTFAYGPALALAAALLVLIETGRM